MRKVVRRIPWRLYAAELGGTALLVLFGLSFVIFDFGTGTPMVNLIPDAGLRRLLTGFLFGSTGALITISPIGKESGAHINPVVTIAFWLMRKMRIRHALGYIVSQFVGAAIGCIPLLLWGRMGRSVDFAATIPENSTATILPLTGEIITTFVMVMLLFFFLRHKRLRNFTPGIFPILYAIMVYLEAPLSGTSTNPARSFGPALISGDWTGYWIYLVGPLVGALLGVLLYRHSWLRHVEIDVAKLYHFEFDRYQIFNL